MSEHSIPVDIFNPGQVFACLGFMEAAEVLLGDIEGGFDWTNETDVRFVLRTTSEKNPFETILEFLANANLIQLVPRGYMNVTSEKQRIVEAFPAQECKDKELPCQFEKNGIAINISHWADSSSRDNFKQFAGQQNPSQTILPYLQEGVKKLLDEDKQSLINNPLFGRYPIGRKSWNMDAFSAWTARDVGYSLEDQKHDLMSSPVVEFLAAIGLEHARPSIDENNKLNVKYGVWGTLLSPNLSRAMIGGGRVGIPMRLFHFTRNKSGTHGEYKQVTFATEVKE